jgi:MOSC domain-containing protein YiiM
VNNPHEGQIAQLSISPGGVPKLAVPEARVSRLGLEGDAHHNDKHHGGPERAVCLFALEMIEALAAEGHAIEPGTIGENVTIEGLDWNLVTPGTRLRLGERVVLEVTRYTTPCFKIASVFLGRDSGRVSQKHHPGWSRVYTRVLVEGTLRAGDPIRLLGEREAAEVGAASS